MMRYLLKEYFYKTILSVRFFVFMGVLLLSLYSLFHPMATQLAEQGYEVGALEMLPCLLYSPGTLAVYFVVFVLLILVYPMWDGSLNQMARLGRTRWMAMQHIYIAITAAIYYLIWTCGFIVAFLPCISWDTAWSSFMELITDESKYMVWKELKVNVNMKYSADIMGLLNPVATWWLTFLLHVLGCFFAGLLAVTFNVCFRRGTGTVIAFFVTGGRGILDGLEYILASFGVNGKLQHILLEMRYYISPLYQSDLSVMAERTTRALSASVGIAIIYYVCVIALVLVYNYQMLRKIDLIQE